MTHKNKQDIISTVSMIEQKKMAHKDELVKFDEHNFEHVIECLKQNKFQITNTEDFNKFNIASKWKDDKQIVFKVNDKFYKVYELQNNCNDFDSYVRHYLINEYRKDGLNWEIKRIKHKNKIYDIEIREKIDVASENTNFTDIMINFKRFFSKIEKLLNTEDILKKVQKEGFLKNAVSLKILRNCSNKQSDYGIKNGKYYLLDDADFILMPVDIHGKIVKENKDIYVKIYDNCYFTIDKYFDNLKNNGMSINKIFDYNKSNYYTLIFDENNEKNENKVKIADYLLKNEREKMIEKNAEFLYLSSASPKYSDFKLQSENDFKKEIFETLESNDKNYDALYSTNFGRKMYQSEIWHICYQRCEFCFNGKDNIETCEERQLQSIRDIEQKIKFDLDYSRYNGISFIGGEFFQGEAHSDEVLKRVLDLFKYCAVLYEKKYIGMCWITATLTQKKEKIKGLFEFLDWCKENNMFQPKKEYGSSGLWICTSYDVKGRFHNEQQKINWENNMKYLHKKYKFLKFTTNMIITGPMIRSYINGDLNLSNLKKKYKTTIFLKQPVAGDRFQTAAFLKKNKNDKKNPEELPNFDSCERTMHSTSYTPTKKDYHEAFLRSKKYANEKWYKWDFFPSDDLMKKFLITIAQRDPEDFKKLFNIAYRSDELQRVYNDKERNAMNIRNKQTNTETIEDHLTNTCGHVMTYACYSNNNDCCLCLRDEIGKKFVGF